MTVKRVALKTLFLMMLASSILAAEKRPNIVFIFTDDHAPHAIGAYDGWLKEVNPTPNIDQHSHRECCFATAFAPIQYAAQVGQSFKLVSIVIRMASKQWR